MFTPGRSMLLEAEAAVLLLLLLVAPPPAAAAAATNTHTGMVVGGRGGRARVEDLPYIRCQASTALLHTSPAAPSAAASLLPPAHHLPTPPAPNCLPW